MYTLQKDPYEGDLCIRQFRDGENLYGIFRAEVESTEVYEQVSWSSGTILTDISRLDRFADIFGPSEELIEIARSIVQESEERYKRCAVQYFPPLNSFWLWNSKQHGVALPVLVSRRQTRSLAYNICCHFPDRTEDILKELAEY